MSSPSLHPALRRWLHNSIPAPVTVRWSECICSVVGALVGILFIGTIMRMTPGAPTPILLLVVPMGASAVLLFAMPASPFTQPWSIIGGNLVVTTVGVTFALLVNDPVVVSALTISVAIADMFALCYMHPPSGTIALIAVVGSPAVHALGHRSVLESILTQSMLPLVDVLVYHAATDHRYPHTQRLPAAGRPLTTAGFIRVDIVATLRRQNELLDINLESIEAILREIQLWAYTHTFQAFICADIMTTPVITVLAGTSIPRALELLCQHDFKALPVIDEGRHVVGIVTCVNLLSLAPTDMHQTLRRRFGIGALTPPCTADYMRTRVQTITANAPMSNLVPMLASAGHYHIPMLDVDGRLAGIITESDLVGGLYRQANIKPRTAWAAIRPHPSATHGTRPAILPPPSTPPSADNPSPACDRPPSTR